jgi:hypothetical protein
MSKITASAIGESCTVRIPNVCNHNVDTVVAAHLSGVRFGHGFGQKVSDLHIAYCCSSCHDALDGRINSGYSKDELKLMHIEAVIETQIKLVKKGLIQL